MPLRAFVVLLILVNGSSILGKSPGPGPGQHGFNFLDANWNPQDPVYGSQGANQSLHDMRNKTAANWIALTFLWYIPDKDTPSPIAPGKYTPSDEDIINMCEQAKKQGVLVKFRPAVNLDPSNPKNKNHWRGQIGENFTPAQWDTFFVEYQKFITHYAALAKKVWAGMMAVGLELVAASTQEAHWRDVVKAVRTEYGGPISYDANHGNEDKVQWWDAVDYIGVDAYYNLAASNPEPTVADLVQAWQPIKEHLRNLSKTHEKKVHFAEIGYCSTYHTNSNPAACWKSKQISMQAQANCYQAVLETFWTDAYFFSGIFFWDWNTDPNGGGENTGGYTPQHKKQVEEVVYNYYSHYPPPPVPPPLPPPRIP